MDKNMIKKQKVLIVDDNPNNIRLAADTLKDLDISIIFATSGFKAIKIVNENSIDLILMDINMPQMDGFETVKKIDKNIPIIFLTALDDKDSVLRAFDEGGLDYITKPFYPEELRARVLTHLKLAALSKNLSLEVYKKTKELKKSIYIDHITGSWNASKLYIDLKNKNIAMMIHIKNLEDYEIAFGLDSVEKLLLTVVSWLKTNYTKEITTYNISSSDFVCLFNVDDCETIKKLSLDIQKKLELLNVELVNGSTININTIVTIARAKQDKLIQCLKIAKIEAKHKNLNYYVFENNAMDTIKEQEKNIYWIDFLKKSFKNDLVVPFFQPIAESKTGKIVKYECLVRIIDEDKVITPFFFLDAAKKLGAITKITKVMIEKSCKYFANSTMNFSINITAEDLTEKYLSSMLDKMTKKYNIKKEQITLEILEEISVFGSDDIIQELLLLKNDGYRIALDDFGSENASFSRMLELPIDIIKIDAMFIKNIHTHKNSRLIVEGIIHLAKLFNYEVIAEFVHNEEVLKVINELGIEFSQGYFFSPPLQAPILENI
ncbi:MAG: EAL domain-containing protein (putative c-di-GMP-specific phosphodiesterase class I) [Sulfurimonas sp.]|jgi:EAL domain-containing protein (putative c-di-GMP-specific phosphodiesterase class I)/CheY-like chemotaxis protein